MKVFELLVSVLTLSMVLFNQVMLAGGLAVTPHSIVTDSSSRGLLLFPLISDLLRGTMQYQHYFIIYDYYCIEETH